jgi:hypothetical protein
VFSFVASSTTTSFSGDIKLFMNYLVSNYSLSTSLYLKCKLIPNPNGTISGHCIDGLQRFRRARSRLRERMRL